MKSESPLAYVVTALERTQFTPARLRIRVPKKRGERRFFQSLLLAARGLNGFLNGRVNAKTASVLLVHDQASSEFIKALNGLGLIDVQPREKLNLEKRLPALPKFTRKEIESMKFLLYAGLTVFQVLRGKPFGAGTSLLSQSLEFWNRIPFDKREPC